MRQTLSAALLAAALQPALADAAWRLEAHGRLLQPRAAHQITPLAGGSAWLVSGGCSAASCEGVQRSAEWLDATSGRSTALPEMQEPRVAHAAAPLPDGSALLVGGWTGSATTASAERFDPLTRRFQALPQGAAQARMDGTLTALADGRLLLAGGNAATNQPLAQTELFDPQRLRFVPGASMAEARAHHTAVRLPDGRVLIAGGLRARNQATRSAELFDPASGRFSPTGEMTRPRCKHAALALRDGRVLVIGGSADCGARQRHADSEIYDPASGRFSPGPRLLQGRYKIVDAVSLLADGAVLVAGDGLRPEIWVPGSPAFVVLDGAFDAARAFAAATPLLDGSVLISGGYDEGIRPAAQTWRVRR